MPSTSLPVTAHTLRQGPSCSSSAQRRRWPRPSARSRIGWRSKGPNHARGVGSDGPRGLAGRRQTLGTSAPGHLQYLDAIAIGILDEREAVAALADRVRRLLRFDALLLEAGEGGV